MNLSIAERLRPFSHAPGTRCVLPGSPIIVTAYPALLVVSHENDDTQEEFSLPIQGPVSGFTVQLDLEKKKVSVWGTAKNGYFRYHIAASEHGHANIWTDKQTCHTIINAVEGELLRPGSVETPSVAPAERLSLGCHKKQDWSRIATGYALEEVLPVWMRAGQLSLAPNATQAKAAPRPGVLSLVDALKQSIDQRDKLAAADLLHQLLLVGFSGILCPRKSDTDHQGIIEGCVESAMPLLPEGAALIKQLFVQETDGTIDVLPVLPPALHCGRFLNVRVEAGSLDMEWSKKAIRRMVFNSRINGPVTFRLQQGICQYRLRTGTKDSGRTIQTGEAIEVVKGESYWFDRFTR